MDEKPMPDTLDTGGAPETTDQKLDALSASVGRRFGAVDEALTEQRRYTEFAFDKLATGMKAGFDKVDGRFNRLERKLDQFIDTQAKTNELVERRLKALEPRQTSER
jgi:hypothetical protein